MSKRARRPRSESIDRIAFGRRAIAWDDIYQFVVIDRPWARYVMVEELGAGEPTPYRLPAPMTSRILADPAFTCVLPTVLSVEDVQEYAAASDLPLSADERKGVDELWARNFDHVDRYVMPLKSSV